MLRTTRQPRGSTSSGARAAPSSAGRRRWGLSPDRIATALVVVLPGLLTLLMAFQAGGFFAGTTASGVLVVLAVGVLWVVLADRPLAGLSWWGGVAAGGLAALALWQLVSSAWSDAPARALLEHDRTLLYALLIVLCAALPRSRTRGRAVLTVLAAALAAIATAALLTKLLPDTFPSDLGISVNRLAYPLSYW